MNRPPPPPPPPPSPSRRRSSVEMRLVHRSMHRALFESLRVCASDATGPRDVADPRARAFSSGVNLNGTLALEGEIRYTQLVKSNRAF